MRIRPPSRIRTELMILLPRPFSSSDITFVICSIFFLFNFSSFSPLKISCNHCSFLLLFCLFHFLQAAFGLQNAVSDTSRSQYVFLALYISVYNKSEAHKMSNLSFMRESRTLKRRHAYSVCKQISYHPRGSLSGRILPSGGTGR